MQGIMMKELVDIISDERVNDVMCFTDFGLPHRDVIKYALLKYATGYQTGSTAKYCLIEFGLISQKLVLTKKGKEYLYFAFYNNTSL
jgi:hypothetical protein